MKIRDATRRDVQAISDLARSLTEKYVVPEFPGPAREALLLSMGVNGIEKQMDIGCQYHVAEIDGHVVGVVGIKDNKHLYHLFVAEPFQRRGIGRELWSHAMRKCLEAGNPGEFSVNSSTYAQRAYESFGFVAQAGPLERNGIVSIPMVLVVNR
jgi:GNAT superfamily N-acetyltransferase